MEIDHKCFECGYEGTTEVSQGKVMCPRCHTLNDVWLVGNTPPDKHREKPRVLKGFFNSLKQVMEFIEQSLVNDMNDFSCVLLTGYTVVTLLDLIQSGKIIIVEVKE